MQAFAALLALPLPPNRPLPPPSDYRPAARLSSADYRALTERLFELRH